MIKKYLPVRVKNPTSLHHVVRVSPGQSIVLRLDEHLYPEAKVHTSGSNMFLSAFSEIDNEKRYELTQDSHTSEWARYSSCYLGEIWIDSKSQMARLVVMLECATPEKKKFVTVVNPKSADIRLWPHNILEVVVFNSSFGEQDSWMWEWEPRVSLEIEQIGYDYLNIETWQRYYLALDHNAFHEPYSRLPRARYVTNPHCRQHHFWFRFNESVYKFLAADCGTKRIGELKFYGQSQGFYNKNITCLFEHTACLYMDIDSKYMKEVVQTLAMPKHDRLSPPLNLPLLPSPSIRYNQYSAYNRVSPVKKVFLVKDVDVELKQTDSMEAGCRVMESCQYNYNDHYDNSSTGYAGYYDDYLNGMVGPFSRLPYSRNHSDEPWMDSDWT